MSGSSDQDRGKERAAGLLLIAAAAVALGLANSPLADTWHHLLEAPLGIVLPRVGILTPHLFVADGFSDGFTQIARIHLIRFTVAFAGG